MPLAMRFLERLMPAAQPGTAPVRPVLPSRFGAPSRDRFDEGRAIEEAPVSEDADQTRRERTSWPGHGDSGEATPAPALPHGAAAADEGFAAPRHAPTPRLAAHTPPQETQVLAARARAPSSEPLAARGASSAVAAPRVARVTPPTHDAGAPLRDQVRAHRVAVTPADGPTIVHVTIDRIEVRAPIATAHPERAQPTHRTSSWKSLDDYLRHRGRAGEDA